MQMVTAGRFTVFYAQAHHHVIEAWVNNRRARQAAPHLLTLDRHTDLMSAFLRDTYARLVPDDGLLAAETIEQEAMKNSALLERYTVASTRVALKKLAHDEHIDAARRAHVIDQVHLLQSSTIGTIPSWASVQCYDVQDLPAAALALEPARLDPFIQMVQKATGLPLDQTPYILDIDLDYFFSREGAKPSNPQSFHSLVRNAQLITVALEPQCVRQPEILDNEISARSLLNLLLQRISEVG